VKRLLFILTTALTVSGAPLVATSEELTPSEYFITQLWSQEKDFKRPYYVSAPKVPSSQQCGINHSKTASRHWRNKHEMARYDIASTLQQLP
jgi:hypothetical protein